MKNEQFDLGMMGFGVMALNLLLNMADHSLKVIGYNKGKAKLNRLKADATPGIVVDEISTLEKLIRKLQVPRRILLLVPTKCMLQTNFAHSCL